MPFDRTLVILASYLVGSIPFGYLIGWRRSVNLFAVGSGNIGATNVGRVLGTKYGVLCFALDLLKGIVPVAVARTLFHDDLTPTLAAAAAFLGHLFPLVLGFRGGKGVATGAGTVLVLVPLPAAFAVAAWVLTLLASRTVSLASLAAVLALSITQLTIARELTPPTLYVLVGTLFVIVKHRSNIGRLFRGNENTLGEFTMRAPLLRVLHVVAVGLWCGGEGFFNFVTAPSLFRSFEDVVATSPSDRTANVAIVPAGSDEATRKKLGSALAGAGVGPIFPKYFALMTACGVIALLTAWSWRREGKLHRARFLIAIMALATVLAGWPISQTVSELRLARFHIDPDIANYAKEMFGPWHVASLLLSMVSVLLASVLLVLAAWLPNKNWNVEA